MVIGITGGVGSGKSTVLKMLRDEFGAVICMADELGHEAMEPDTDSFKKIIDTFGSEILDSNGSIDRGVLAQIVYQDSAKLQALNQIVHPFVKERISRLIAETKDHTLFVLETAILFETKCDELCDEVWGIITSDSIRIQRLMSNRGYTYEKAVSIMKKQMNNEQLEALCNRVILNDEGQNELQLQVQSCVQNVLAKRW